MRLLQFIHLHPLSIPMFKFPTSDNYTSSNVPHTCVFDSVNELINTKTHHFNHPIVLPSTFCLDLYLCKSTQLNDEFTNSTSSEN